MRLVAAALCVRLPVGALPGEGVHRLPAVPARVGLHLAASLPLPHANNAR